MRSIIRLSLFLFALAGNAVAGQAYWGVDAGFIDYESRGFETDFNTVGAIVGYEFNQYLGAETFASVGLEESYAGSGPARTKLDIEHMVGVRLKGQYKFTESFGTYVYVGYTDLKMGAVNNSQETSDSTSDGSYGMGVSYSFNSASSACAGYVSYIDKSFVEISGILLSYRKSF